MISFQDIKSTTIRLYRRLYFNTGKQQAFLEDLSVLLEDGVPANRAIEMLSRIYSGMMKEVSLDVLKSISKGHPLAEGMRPWFQTTAVELVRVGEEGGVLAHTIQSAADMLKEKKGAMASVIAALIYPVTVIIAGALVMVYMKNSVFVNFSDIKPISTWPAIGQNLIAVATFIQHWFWLLIIFMIAAIFSIRYLMINYIGDLRNFLDHLPIFSLYKKLAAAQLMETLGLLISNGVVFKSALKIIQYNATPYLITHLMKMERLLSTGKDNIADVLDTGLINISDILRLRVIAEAKGFEHALIRLGKYASENGIKTIKSTAKISGGILLLLGAGMIVFMVLGVYTVGMFLGTAGI